MRGRAEVSNGLVEICPLIWCQEIAPFLCPRTRCRTKWPRGHHGAMIDPVLVDGHPYNEPVCLSDTPSPGSENEDFDAPGRFDYLPCALVGPECSRTFRLPTSHATAVVSA